MNRLLLVLSHLTCFAIGAFLFWEKEESAPALPKTESTRTFRPSLPEDMSPLRAATSADYRRAFEAYFAEGRDTIDSHRLFQQWALVDPDAAVLAISEIYHIHRACNLLSNLVQEIGKELAPSLVKHYGDFEYIPHSKLHWITGRALAQLAKEDPDQALDLIRELPVSPENRPLDDLISGMDGKRLETFLGRMSGTDADLFEEVDSNFWQSLAGRAWRVLPPEEYQGLFHRFDQPDMIRSLTDGALKEARNFGSHDHFVRLFKSLPSPKQDQAMEVFQARLARMPASSLEGFREASEEWEATRLLELIHATPEQ